MRAIGTLTAGQRIEDLVGHTPLVRFDRLAAGLADVTILAKLESRNPGGSVKDRAALGMILDGERTGRLVRGKTILDATSGNTGIAYAWIGAAKGYAVELCLPASASAERKAILRAYGVRIVETPAAEGSDGAIREARRRFAADPDRFFYPDQYSNPANWRAHYDGTAVEILEQTGGRLTHFVAALGTSGTFVGVARRLRAEKGRAVRLVSVQPDSPFHGLEGLKHMPSALVPAIYDPGVADENLWMRTEEAQALVRRVAREEGVFIGPSGGAALAAALRIGREHPGAIIVTVLPDGGERYLSERFWSEES
ncbi:MAG TPA: cysteine synthase family protein [Thermodesulfobacteriota bacterium]